MKVEYLNFYSPISLFIWSTSKEVMLIQKFNDVLFPAIFSLA